MLFQDGILHHSVFIISSLSFQLVERQDAQHRTSPGVGRSENSPIQLFGVKTIPVFFLRLSINPGPRDVP